MWKVFLVVCALCFAYNAVYALDLNQASATELVQIKGIGQKTAEKIVAERTRAGRFISFEDFSLRVKGMGKKKIQRIKEQGVFIDIPQNEQPSTVMPQLGEKIMYVRPKKKDTTH
ncbi:ComEA family DNA-binding protein [Pelistega ratti]|uniref:ComEA family DNA-binding protein n=1 Tax=Pelistega ratti TaxID=2652177 RepID=UPI00135B5A20|nr:DUF655 domain-containing protein [Pelistega ratti]